MATKPKTSSKKLPRQVSASGSSSDGFPICIVRILKKDNGFDYFGRETVWKVLSCRVNLTRYWAASTAELKLAWTSGPDGSCFAVQPPTISPQDIIEIFMGYSDTLDCDPDELKAPSTGGYGYRQLSSLDPTGTLNLPIASAIFTYPWGVRDGGKNRINKVFHGVVDSGQLKLGAGMSPTDGITYTVTCRDTLRYLVDNKFSAELTVPNDPEAAVPREAIIKALVLQGGGVLGQGETPKATAGSGAAWQCGPREYVPEGSKTVSYSSIEKSGRLDIKLGHQESSIASNYIVLNKFPKDVIQHFSTVETRPMELYASNKTGAIYWTERYIKGLDPNHQGDALANRQYAYMTPFDLSRSDENGRSHGQIRTIQPTILAAKLDWSTVATVTNFTLINPLSSGTQQKAESVIVSAKQVGAQADKKYLAAFRPFIVNRFLFDDTLTSDNQAKDNEAKYVLQAMLDTFAKDVRGGMISVPGDPDFEVGEAVQLFNTGLFSEETFRAEAVSHMFAVGGTSTGYIVAAALASPEATPVPEEYALPGLEYLEEGAYARDPDVTQAKEGT